MAPLYCSQPLRCIAAKRSTAARRTVTPHAAAQPPPPPQAAPPLRHAQLGAAAAALSLLLASAPPVDAKTVAVAVSDLSLAPCANPEAAGTPGTSTFKAKCFELSGTATNPDKETLRNADVYGIVLDAENDPVLRSGRIGAIQTLPPGETRFTLQITAAASQPLPFKLKNFRASGTTGAVNVSGNPYDTDFDAGTFADGGATRI